MQISKTFIRAALPLLACLLTLAPQLAQAEDVLVKRRLEARGVKYKMDKDGDFLVVNGYRDSGRSQQVFVSGRTETIGGFTLRKIFSPAAVMSRNPVDGAKALELLAANSINKIGAWEIRGGVLFVTIKLPDTISAAELQSAMDTAATIADDMEIKLTGKDEL